MNQKTYSLLLNATIAFLHFTALGVTFPLLSSMIFAPGFELLGPEATPAEKSYWLSLILGALPLTQLLSAPFFGSMSDLYGRKQVLNYAQRFGISAYFLGMIGVLLHQTHIILVCRVLDGISSGSAAIQGAVIGDIATSSEKLRYFGYLGMACGLGFSIGPYVGGQLLDAGFATHNPYFLPFLFAFLCKSCNLFLVQKFFRETFIPRKTATHSLLYRLTKVKKLIANPLFLVCFTVVFLFYFGWSFYWNFSPVLWISRYAYSPADISHMYSYGSIAFAICSGLLIQPLVKRFQVSSILFYALFLLSITFISLLVTPGSCKLFYVVPFQQYFLALFAPSISTILSTNTSPNEQGEAFGLFQSVHAIGDALGPLLSAPLMSYSLASPLVVAAVCMFAACTIIKMSLERRLNIALGRTP